MGRSLAAVIGLVAIAVLASDAGGPPPTPVSLPDTADQVLYGVDHNVTIDGVRRIRLEADTVYFYQTSQTAELMGVKVEFYSVQGALRSTVISDEGTYEWRSGDMEARGNVIAHTPDERRLTTEVLAYDQRSEIISGPETFVFDAPDRHLEGDGFTADPDFTSVTTSRPRRGRIRDTDVRRP